MALPFPTDNFFPLSGRCSCATISYQITAFPLITHICYCTWCQRESGSVCGLNTLIESSYFKLTASTKPELISGPTPSGNGQTNARCPLCHDTLFKYYGANRHMTYVKAGTLDRDSFQRVMEGERVHIYAGSKPEWVGLEGERKRGVGVFEEYYVREEVWRKEALERREGLMERVTREKKIEGSEDGDGDGARE
ncbi:hypothetical protein BU23DRAFT_598412 [Bimuria novae-zelandiae CBS 107.79]|uniref:CENP-V/GFA domain-containing protein n=1 Tax=Bimuria novae-zelandiae CBS 107.79 TaxID=1447943 RepID=A0A6A5VB36_9PLEO|nr:hypothetical protein BU23DRAFT_598412 [Bimuria novae-zelandiae CBS 107.79]